MSHPLSSFACVKLVQSADELLTTRFAGGVNALCWPRQLPGGIAEVIAQLTVPRGITTLGEERLLTLPLSASGKAAVDFMLQDLRLLREHGLDPIIDCVNGYTPEEEPAAVRTDVCSFHADSATAEADTYLCTYFGPSSEGLRNEEAIPIARVAELRAKLLAEYGGPEDDGFTEFLHENFYDLHYRPAPNAQPYTFGLGNLWRIATEYPGSPVSPCIHRAPDPIPGAPPRLLLIS